MHTTLSQFALLLVHYRPLISFCAEDIPVLVAIFTRTDTLRHMEIVESYRMPVFSYSVQNGS
jgi:hypothetical protein